MGGWCVCVKGLRVCGYGWLVCLCEGVCVKGLRVCGYGWLVSLCEGVEGVWVWLAGVFV